MKPDVAIAILLSGVTVTAACSPRNDGTSGLSTQKPAAPDRRALRRVALPDLSPMSPAVQKQIRDQDDSLAHLTQSPATPPAELATAYGKLGKMLMAAESFPEAEPYFLNAEALAPGEVRWPYYLAHLYRLRGESVTAAAYFERALQIRPDEVAALVWLGEVYVDQGRLEQAEPLFARALSRQPRLLAARFGLGRAALAKRNYGQAVEHLEAALALDRRASVVHYPLAMAYRGLGKVDLAEAHARQRGDVEIGPPDPLMQEVVEALQSVVAYENRGDQAMARGDYAAAAAEFRKGLGLAPDKLSARHKLATTLSLTGDVPGAVRQFQEVLRRSPEFAGAHYSLGVLLQSDGQYDLAIDRFSAAVQYEPTYLEARLQLAHALRRRGRPDAALRQYAEAIKIDPRLAEARFGQAMALVRLNRYQEARDWLAEAMNLHPDRREFAQALARLLAAAPGSNVRDGRRALALTQELIKGPQTAEVRETMAMALAEIGEYEKAVAWQREAMAASERAGEHATVSQMNENLKRYERRQPCRTPWRGDPLWENR